jgi:hypothetical protein
MTKESERYEEVVGRPPPPRLPDDHPYAWQWEYRGTKDEREELLERLDPQPEVEQDSLFDA